MTRIIGGSKRGQPLRVPPKGTRPTSDRVREALFSRLEHFDAIQQARILDLYAGSGALGIEALSRGADSAQFVEAHSGSARVCERNLSTLNLKQHAVVRVGKVKTYLSAPAHSTFHTVLADPPYDLDEADAVLELLLNGWLAAEAVIMWEQPVKAPALQWPSQLRDLGAKVYGETRLNFAELVA